MLTRKRNIPLIALLVLGAILRIYHIDYQSVWLDEIHTLNEANPSLTWKGFYDALLTSEPHPPMYFALVRILFSFFGYKTIVMRLFSAVLGVISIYAMYLLGKEFSNKRVGFLAALFLTVNCFHLYYSQEGRPYIFLVLFTILSFWKLSVFIKAPTRRNAVLYGVFTLLMLYGHFFGLLALFAQYFILFMFATIVDRKERTHFIVNSTLAGGIAILFFLPALPLFLRASSITEIWIPAPTLDVYTMIFKEFFGNAELVLGIVAIFSIACVIRLTKLGNFEASYEKITTSKPLLTFMIVGSWIAIVLIVPLIKSYVSLPMLISRYFIVILPAIMLLLAIGVNQFSNHVVRNFLISCFVLFSMTDILVVKKYYKNVNKAQFREATNFIIENNKERQPVVSALGWYLGYFFKDRSPAPQIVTLSLDAYAAQMKSDPSQIRAFWYFDGHSNNFNPSPDTKAFLDQYFYVENNYDGFQAWTKHYVLLKDMPATVDISKYKKLQTVNGSPVKYNLEAFQNDGKSLQVNGWAFLENQAATQAKIDVVLIKDGNATRLQTQKVIRTDVTDFAKNQYNLDNSGFSAQLELAKLAPGTYQLGIYLQDKTTKAESLIVTDKTIVR